MGFNDERWNARVRIDSEIGGGRLLGVGDIYVVIGQGNGFEMCSDSDSCAAAGKGGSVEMESFECKVRHALKIYGTSSPSVEWPAWIDFTADPSA